jgi:Tfp pilus assembly protein PilF
MVLMLRAGQALWRFVRRPRTALGIVGLVSCLAVGGILGWAEYHFRAARHSLAEERLDEARQHIGVYLRFWPRGKQAHLLAARIERMSGNLEEARRFLTEYARLHGPSEESQLEWVLMRAQGGDLDEVEPGLWTCIREDSPFTTQILQTLAYCYLHLSRISPAKAALDLWIEREPHVSRAWCLRGFVFERLGRMDDAVANYQRALELAPDRSKVRLRLVNLYLNQHMVTEAEPHARHLARTDPDNPEVVVVRAQLEIAQGDEDQAHEVLQRGLQQHPNDIDMLRLLGQIECNRDHAPEGEALFRRGLAIKPHETELLFRLYKCLWQQGREKEANEVRSQYEAVLAIDRRLRVLMEGVVERSPHDPELLSEVGAIWLRLGEEEQGLNWLYRALKENPRHKPTHELLVRYYRDKRQFDKAAEHRQALAQIEPESPPAAAVKP